MRGIRPTVRHGAPKSLSLRAALTLSTPAFALRAVTRPALAMLAFALPALAGLASPAPIAAQAPVSASEDEARLLRFPHIGGGQVAFTFAGDLYTVPVEGGRATRLTSHEGLELFARFSPDGRSIAFSGEYGGNRQVHLIPATGGEPRQLTWYPDVGPMPPRGGYDHLPLDWTPDGERILVRANRTPFGERVGRYYLVDPDGGLETPLQIPEGGTGATYDPSGTELAYTIKSREWRHWKRYQGGRQQDVWTYDLAGNTSERLTDFTGTDNFPMWVGETIYFVSDRDENARLNLHAYDTGTGETRQVTFHEEFDVLWPSRGEGGIVYENGGWIWHFDPATEETRRIPVTLASDRPHTTPYVAEVADRIESFDISPSGKRAVFGARGEIFSVPAEHGNIRNLTGTPGVREREVSWSPDGRWFAWLSDASGSYQIWVTPADGSAEPRRLTDVQEAWIEQIRWSPDSERLAFHDNRNRLTVVDVSSGDATEVDASSNGSLSPFAWSADGRWMAYAKNAETGFSSIWLWSRETGATARVTSDETDDSNPAFDPGGRFLYFTSARDFDFSFGGGSSFDSRIYVATLREDVGHPFPPLSDEEPAVVGGEAEGEGDADAGSGSAATDPLRIDLEGLGTRVMPLPGLSPGGYFGLVPTSDGLLYVSQGALKRYSLEEREASTVLEGIQGYAVNADASQLLYRSGSGYGIVPARPGQSNESGRLDLGGMRVRIDPEVEWAQIYHDAWLITRDFFYDVELHRVEWDAMYRKYLPLVEHVAHRSDLDYLIAELVAEMNVGHAYVSSAPGGSPVERVDVALLGAELEAAGDRYRVANVFPGENWHDEFRSPLTEPGVGVREGDYLLRIDGEEVTTADNPYRFLVDKADRIVEVTVSADPSGASPRSYEVRPVESELGLRYQEWVADNARLVDSLSNGRIGYVHLPNTGVPGHRELYEHFPPQHLKEAMILDDRYNGGGFIPEEMALLVGRPLLNFWARRNVGLGAQPAVVHTGPKAVLINGQSSSGGDAFPYYFRALGLGPLIGERTWGGLVGISGNPSFVDGGSVTVPRFAFVDLEGNWAVEGEGVSPDIEVLDRPEAIAAGREPIVERAVQYLLEELEKEQYQRPGVPRGPVRRGGGPGGGGGS